MFVLNIERNTFLSSEFNAFSNFLFTIHIFRYSRQKIHKRDRKLRTFRILFRACSEDEKLELQRTRCVPYPVSTVTWNSSDLCFKFPQELLIFLGKTSALSRLVFNFSEEAPYIVFDISHRAHGVLFPWLQYLGCSDLLNFNGVIHDRSCREVLLHKVFKNDNSHVRVVQLWKVSGGCMIT